MNEKLYQLYKSMPKEKMANMDDYKTSWLHHCYRTKWNDGLIEVYYKGELTKTISNEKALLFHLKKVEEEEKIVMDKIDEVASYVESFDSSSFFDKKTMSLYLFNHRITFNIRRTPDGKFCAKFVKTVDTKGVRGPSFGTITHKDLSVVMERLKTKIDKEFKGKKLSYALTGNLYDFRKKLQYMALKEYKRKEYPIITEMDVVELNKTLKVAMEKSKKETLEKEKINTFEKELKEKNIRKKVIDAFSLGELDVYLLSSEIHVKKARI